MLSLPRLLADLQLKSIDLCLSGHQLQYRAPVGALDDETRAAIRLRRAEIIHFLRARNAASGGEEMLRLRAYEKLQNLVARGAVKKNGKKYKGLPSALANAIAPQNGHLAGVR